MRVTHSFYMFIIEDYNLFRLSLEGMARGHNKMGIKAEYVRNSTSHTSFSLTRRHIICLMVYSMH